MRGRRARSGRRASSILAALALLAYLTAGCRTAGKQDKPISYRLVLPTIAFEMISDTPSIPIIDLRSPEEYEGSSGHLPKAVNIPFSRLSGTLEELELLEDLRFLRELTFIVYCRGEDDCGPRGAQLFIDQGCVDTVLMRGGIEEWIRDGYGTVRQGVYSSSLPMPEDPMHRIPIRAEGGADNQILPDPP